jgi:hypothetical protein
MARLDNLVRAPFRKNRRERFFVTEGNPKDSPQGSGLQSLLLKDIRASCIYGKNEAVINQPAKAGFFMYGAPVG